MKFIFYSMGFSVSSFFLIICIKNNKWKTADKILQFRKSYLAKHMRNIVKNMTPP